MSKEEEGEKQDQIGGIELIGYIPMPPTGIGAMTPQDTGQVEAARSAAEPSQAAPEAAPAVARQQAPVESPAEPAGLDPRVRVGQGSYVSPKASVTGDVSLGQEVFVGPFASVRGDTGFPIFIGGQSNVQDGALVHAIEGASFVVDGRRYAVYVGPRVSLAHRCLIHGPAVIQEGAFVGFGSMVLNSTIGRGAVVWHMSYISDVDIPAGRMVPPGTVVNTPEQARALPKVPADVRQFVDKVIQANREHARRYAASSRR